MIKNKLVQFVADALPKYCSGEKCSSDNCIKCAENIIDKHNKRIRAKTLEEVREYFNSFNPTNIDCDMETWQMGINNYINRMLKEQNNE